MKLYFAVALMVLLAAVAVSARPGGRGVSSRHFLSLVSMFMHHHQQQQREDYALMMMMMMMMRS